MPDRNILCICLTIFGVITSVAWAIATVNILAPTPAKTAKEICASYPEARSSVYCVELAKKDAR